MPRNDVIVYVSQKDAGRISAYRLAESGDLALVQHVEAGGMVMPLAISPDRRFLYAALRDEGDFALTTFAIDGHSGELSRLGQVPAAQSITYIATDRSGSFLFAATNPHTPGIPAVLSQNAIGPQGWLQTPLQSWITPPKLHAVLPDPANRFVLATSCNGEAILRYPLDAASGVLGDQPLEPVIMQASARRGPRHLRFHPNHRYLYVLNEYDATIAVYSYDPRDAGMVETQLVDTKPASYVPGDRRGRGVSAGAADIHLTPDGRWLYASVRGALSMAIFAVDAQNGSLTPAGHFAVLAEPRGFAIDPFGRHMIVAADACARIVIYRIDAATGQCSQIAEHDTGGGPNWVECLRLP